MVPEAPEDLLKKEKEMVGIYLSSHPLDKFSFEIKHFTSHNLLQIQEILDNNQHEEPFAPREVCLAGLVTGVTSALARTSGRPWALLHWEDYSASRKFTLFGKEYEKFLPYMREGREALLIKCTLQERDQYKRKGQEAQEAGPKKKSSVSRKFYYSLMPGNHCSLSPWILGVEEISETFRQELSRFCSGTRAKSRYISY